VFCDFLKGTNDDEDCTTSQLAFVRLHVPDTLDITVDHGSPLTVQNLPCAVLHLAMMRLLSLTTCALLGALSVTVAFAPERMVFRKMTALFGKPKFDTQSQKWEKAADDDGDYPYDAVGALLRHGPAPFLARLVNPTMYEQAVLKYMAVEGVSRAEATGNMDAKLNNAADWAYQKMEEKRGAPKVDYTRLKKKDAILVIVWALGITPLTVYVIQKTLSQF